MSDSYTNLLYHIVFSTKDRRPVLKPEHQARLYDYLGGTVRKFGGIALGVNGTETMFICSRSFRRIVLSPMYCET